MSFEPVKNPAVTIELERPIQFLGEPVTSIAIREPTAGDIFRVGTTGDEVRFRGQLGPVRRAQGLRHAIASVRHSHRGVVGADDLERCDELLPRNRPFFYPGPADEAGRTVDLFAETGRAARKLAQRYGQHPYQFADLPIEEVWRLWDAEVADFEEERFNAFHSEG